MPVTGTKPKAPEERRRRNAPGVDWVEVQDVPFENAPKPPKSSPDGRPWRLETKRWWKAISRMPHCVLWTESDWAFALDTMILVGAFHGGDLRRAGEVRLREKVLGTTADALRDLRIRYVQSKPEEEELGVTAINDYKNRLKGRAR